LANGNKWEIVSLCIFSLLKEDAVSPNSAFAARFDYGGHTLPQQSCGMLLEHPPHEEISNFALSLSLPLPPPATKAIRTRIKEDQLSARHFGKGYAALCCAKTNLKF